MTIWRMRIACWIPKATNTHSQYVILIAFPLHHWLHKRTSVLRHTYIGCLVFRVLVCGVLVCGVLVCGVLVCGVGVWCVCVGVWCVCVGVFVLVCGVVCWCVVCWCVVCWYVACWCVVCWYVVCWCVVCFRPCTSMIVLPSTVHCQI